MQFLRRYPIRVALIGTYLLLTVAIGIYALTCDTQWCSLALVIPLTPWPQLEGLIGVNIPRFLLPVAALLNVALLYYLGHMLETLFINRNKN